MFLSKTEQPPPSGNHGRENNGTSAIPTESIVGRAPVQSTQSFIMPDSFVKKSPSIKDLVKDAAPASVEPTPNAETQSTPLTTSEITTTPAAALEIEPQATPETAPSVTPPVEATPETSVETTSKPTDEATTEIIPETSDAKQKTELEEQSVAEAQPIEPTESAKPVESSEPAAAQPTPPQEMVTEEILLPHWLPMLEAVFSKTPTLYASLKNYLPTIEDNIIKIVLKNERQEDDFKTKKSNVLAYLRNNCSNAIEDVVLTIDINMESKKFILDDKDKYEELRHQNPDIVDFIRVLNLRIDS